MGNEKNSNLKSALTVSIITAIITAALTGLIVRTQLGSQQEFAETQRQLIFEEKRLMQKIDLSKQAVALLSKTTSVRRIVALNFFSAQSATAMSLEGAGNHTKLYDESYSRFEAGASEFLKMFGELQGVFIQAKYFFGNDVNKMIDEFLGYSATALPPGMELSLDAIANNIRESGLKVKSVKELLNSGDILFKLIDKEIKQDRFPKLGNKIVTAMFEEISQDFNATNIPAN